ncbi:hypothetical protein DL95DRAFT_468918 [Leptodontidium sp. 2 PMI_412]|nr:hypothetical protein DL95DRAFT_468918 [Leptodontidium sp. 2 PMI_412]
MASKAWQAKEDEYLQGINYSIIANQNLEEDNIELSQMAETQAAIWTSTLQQQKAERPQKRRRISHGSQEPGQEGAVVRDRTPDQKDSSVPIHQGEQGHARYHQHPPHHHQ